MKQAFSAANEIASTPPRQFWRRLFRTSPTFSLSSSNSRGSSHSRRFRRKSSDLDEEKSHDSSGSSSQSGSDDSEHNRKPNREQRVAKYLSADGANAACRPIFLIANGGDLSFHRSSSETREDNNDEDDIDDNSSAGECRDDVCLLRDDKHVFQSHLLLTTRQQRTEEEDRVSLLSEYDELLENRHGSYNVDCVDPLTINVPVAVQKMSLLSLRQELAAQEENIHSQWNYLLPHHRQQRTPNKALLDADLNETNQNQSTSKQEALVPLQIDFPSGKTTEGVIYPGSSQPLVHKYQTKIYHPECKIAEKRHYEDDISSCLNPLGEETPAFSEIISDRTERHKAFYLLRLRNSQKKNNTVARPSMHGGLWTLPELPSDDECSRFSQVSESIGRRFRTGSRSSDAKNKMIREDQLALISDL